MTSVPMGAHRATAVVLSGQAAKFVVQAVGILVLTRILTPGDFGILAMVIGVVGIGAVLADAGLSLAAIQTRHLSENQRSNLFWLSSLVGLSFGLLTVAIANPLAAFFGDSAVAPVAIALSLTLVLSGVSAQFRAHLNRDMRFLPIVSSDVIAQAAGLAAAILLALAGWGYWSLVVQQLVTGFVTLVILIGSARWVPGWPREIRGISALVRFGLGTTVVQVLNYASVNTPGVLLGRSLGAAEAGYYARAYSLFALPMTQLAAPLTRVAVPKISRVETRAEISDALVRAQSVIALGLAGVFAVSAALAEPLVLVLLGDGWRSSVPIFQVLALGGVFQALGYVYYWAFLVTSSTRLQVLYMVPLRLVMIGLIALGVTYGAIGAAWGMTLGLALIWLVAATFAAPQMSLHWGRLIRVGLEGVLLWAVACTPAYLADQFLWKSAPVGVRLLLGMVAVALIVGLAVLVVPRVRANVRACLHFARRMVS